MGSLRTNTGSDSLDNGGRVGAPLPGDPVTDGWSTRPVGASDLQAVDAPPLDKSVPSRLRAAYDRAPALSDRELVARNLAHQANHARASRAHDASQAAYAAAHNGNFLFTPDRPAFDAVIAAGITPEDFDDAQHMQRLAVAEREVSASEAAVAREAKRNAARCRACGALDVPTRLPVVILGATAAPVSAMHAAQEVTVTLDGAGVVCGKCEAVIASAYVADLAADKLDRRRTRADAARAYLRKATVK